MGGVARQHNWALQPTVISIIEAVSQVKPARSGLRAGPGAKHQGQGAGEGGGGRAFGEGGKAPEQCDTESSYLLLP